MAGVCIRKDLGSRKEGMGGNERENMYDIRGRCTLYKYPHWEAPLVEELCSISIYHTYISDLPQGFSYHSNSQSQNRNLYIPGYHKRPKSFHPALLFNPI